MKCAVHTDVDATGYCRNCGKAMCSNCARPVRDVLYCEDCLATVMGHPAPAQAPAVPPPVNTSPASPYGYAAPPPQAMAMPVGPAARQSPVLAFILAFVFPGLGAIYNRQYNKGLVYIAIFAAAILGFMSDLSDGFKAIIGILLGGFFFYTAFEAMQTAQARNLGEAPPADPLESWSKDRPIGPIILIGLGALFLLDNFHAFDYVRVGRFWPLILIGAGLYMFRNKLGGRQ